MDVKVQCAQCLEVPVPAIAMPGIEQLKQPMVRLAIHREGLRQSANPDRAVRAHKRIPCVLRGTPTNRASSRSDHQHGQGTGQPRRTSYTDTATPATGRSCMSLGWQRQSTEITWANIQVR